MVDLYPKDASWTTLMKALSNNKNYQLSHGYTMNNDGWGNLTLSKNGMMRIRIAVSSTSFCCGVQQLGNFCDEQYAEYKHDPIPEEVSDKYIKILLSISKHQYKKGVINAWFYKQPNQRGYQHPTIRDLFIKAGFKRMGKATYNPNSGNMIRGYQLSLPKKV